jgi:prepilin-type N-terminal cleavage/methylation domain-containing protein
MRPSNRRLPTWQARQSGFSLIELMFGAVIAAIAAVAIIYFVMDTISSRQNAAVAADAARVGNAANSFVTANYTTIAAGAMPYTITVAQLQAPTDYLNGAFSTTNHYSQTYAIRVGKTAAGGLETIVTTTGGSAIPDKYLDEIAGDMVEMKVGGGSIATGSNTLAKGYLGSWARDLSVYGLSPGPGHIVAFMAYSNAAVTDDALHRSAHPENPSLNTMSTNVAMAGNAVTGASNVQFNAANQGITFFGGGEHVVGTSDLGISFQTGSGVERMKIFNDGHITKSGQTYFTTAGNAISMAGSWLYGDTSNMALRPATNGGTVYIQGTSSGGGSANLNVNGQIT